MIRVTVYNVRNASPVDFDQSVDPSRLILTERLLMDGDKEIVKEMYEDGTLLSKIEMDYNEHGDVIELREYTSGHESPFKRETKSYNADNLIFLEQTFVDGEMMDERLHEYDKEGRIVKITEKYEDNPPLFTEYKYEPGFKQCAHESYWKDAYCWKEIRNTYAMKKGHEELTEEYIDIKENPYDSRIVRHYLYGEVPNGVLSETYNTDGNLLEEYREMRNEKGDIIRRAWHSDDLVDSVPYAAEEFVYDHDGFCVRTLGFTRGRLNYLQQLKVDRSKRKLVEYLMTDPTDTVLIYKYETANVLNTEPETD